MTAIIKTKHQCINNNALFAVIVAHHNNAFNFFYVVFCFALLSLLIHSNNNNYAAAAAADAAETIIASDVSITTSSTEQLVVRQTAEDENDNNNVCSVDDDTIIQIIESNITLDLIIDPELHFITNMTSAKEEKNILADVCLEQYNALALSLIGCSSVEDRTMTTINFVDLQPLEEENRNLQSSRRTRWRYTVRGQCRNCKSGSSFLCDAAIDSICGSSSDNGGNNNGATTNEPTPSVTSSSSSLVIPCCDPVPDEEFVIAVNDTIQLLHDDNQALGILSVNDVQEDPINTTTTTTTTTSSSATFGRYYYLLTSFYYYFTLFFLLL